ncbi:MAG: T9SS type A sorting domain-containing protein [Candidatus Stahlbacteria bacterium]|nr:T9SS type A sorting domain-containing protein [Candidatus Stahlbacteria bacterium]
MRKILISICVAYVTLLATFLYAQPDTLWTHTYGAGGSDYGYSVQETDDGAYIVAGNTSSYGVGGYDAWLIKTDADGDTLWTRTYGGEADDGARCVQQTFDGGYILAGYTFSASAGNSDAWLIKTDTNGINAWERRFGGTAADYAYSVQQTADSGYIIVGYTSSSGNADVWLIKTNAAGNSSWSNTFGGTAADYGYSVQQTQDGGYIIVGATYSGANGFDVFLIKTDSIGNSLWSNTFGGTAADYGYSVQEAQDGGYIIVGYTASDGAGQMDLWLIKTDATGQLTGERTIGGTLNDVGYCISPLKGSGYIVSGYTSSPPSAGGYDIWLLKLPPNLVLFYPNGGELFTGGTSCQIRWRNYGDAPDSLKLWYSTNGGTTYPNFIYKSTNPTDTSYNWTLPNISSKYMRVKAGKYTAGADVESDVSDFNFIIDSDLPSVFTCIKPKANDTTSIIPTFIWHSAQDTTSGIDYYVLWIDGAVVETTYTDTEYVITLENKLTGGMHNWKVVAYDSVGHSRQTNQTQFLVVAFNLVSPTDSLGVGVSPLLKWSAVGSGINFSHYRLYVNEIVNLDSISNISTSTLPASALADGWYSWYICAVAKDSEEWRSNQTWHFVVDAAPPNRFTLLTPTNNTTVGDSTPTFTWTASFDSGAGLKEYQLWIDSLANTSDIPPIMTNTIPAIPLKEGSHLWTIRAYDAVNNYRVADNTWQIRVDLYPPNQFDLISPADSSVSLVPSPTFRWHSTQDSISGLLEYEVWVNGLLKADNISDTSSTPSNSLTEGNNSWWVIARDRVGHARKSTHTYIVNYESAPPLPFHLSFPEDYDTSYIPPIPVFHWHPSIDEGIGLQKYQLWIDGMKDRDNIPASDTFTTPIGSLDQGLHSWFIVAFDKSGKSTASSDTFRIIAKVKTDSIPPSVPILISPANLAIVTNMNVDCIWRRSENKAQYLIQWAKNSGFVPILIDTLILDTTFRLSLSDTTYYWRVKAIDTMYNESNWSSIWEFTVDTETPATPDLLLPQDSGFASSSRPTFTWGKVYKKTKSISITDNRILERSGNPILAGPNTETLVQFPPTITYTLEIMDEFGGSLYTYETQDSIFTIPVTLSDSCYQWRVKAKDGVGQESPYSVPFTFYFDTLDPQISNPTIWTDTIFTGPFPVYATVTDNKGLHSVELWYKTSIDTNWDYIEMDSVSLNRYLANIPVQLNNTRVWYYVLAKDIAFPANTDREPTTNAYTFIAGNTGTAETQAKGPDKFFVSQGTPNPFVNTTEIEYGLPANTNVRISIYNLAGQEIVTLVNEIKPRGYYTVSWNGRDKANNIVGSGIYLTRIETEKYIGIRKLYFLSK